MYLPIDKYIKCEWCGKLINRDIELDRFLIYGSRRVVFSGDKIITCIDCANENKHILTEPENVTN